MVSRTEKKRLIRKAYNFNSEARKMASCNTLYMGSGAQADLWHRLGSVWPKVSLEEALASATDAQLDAGVAACSNILKYANA